MSKNISNEDLFDRIQKETNVANQKAFSSNHEETTVRIRPDSSITPAKFIIDPLTPGGYKAHPSTIKGMRKDLFIAGNEIDELEIAYQCKCCDKNLDLQFWLRCPYCESEIKL